MRWIDVLRALWRRVFSRPEAEERMDEEMRFHIDMETEKNLRAGMTPHQARRRAVLSFGGVEKHREGMRDGRRLPFVENLLQDARYAARSLRRTPGFTLAVVLTLAVGIGAATAMYGVMSRLLLLPPPHVAAPERVVKLYFTTQPAGGEAQTFSGSDYAFFERLRTESRSLTSVGAYTTMDVAFASGGEAMRARAVVASQGFWAALGTRPALGRFFSDEEARPVGGERVVVLGHGLWRARFGGAAGVLGETVDIKGRSYEVIGVAPRGFRGIDLEDIDLWLPIGAYVDGERDSLTWTSSRGGSWLQFVGRLAPGADPSGAGAEISRIGRDVADEEMRKFGQPSLAEQRLNYFVSAGPVIGALGRDMQPVPEARVSIWLVGIAIVLLGVACSTVASLLLLRAVRRRREVAVRLALGMGWGRMATQLFTESFLLAALGGVVALAVALGGGAWMNRVLLPDLAWEPAEVDWSMLAMTAACVVGTALLGGLSPLLQTRFDPATALREGTQHGSIYRSLLQRGLLVAQIALSVVLLVGAGLFLRSLQKIAALDLGLDRDNVLVATVDFTGTGRSPEAAATFFENALERARALPGVERASLATTIPLRKARDEGRLHFPESLAAVGDELGSTYANYVTPDFFSTTGTQVLRGRDFLPEERDAPVLIINETLARVGWPNGSPLGECVPFRHEDGCATIVGVVKNARKFELREPESLFYYLPLPPAETDERVLLLRLSPGATLGATTLRRALLELDPALPYLHLETLGAALDPQIRPWRLGASVFTAFGVVAMLLAAVGLYSTLAYTTTQRTREIGIRVALGATAGQVLRLVIREGVRIAVVGIVIGLVTSLVSGQGIADLLFEVSPRDSLVLGSAGAALGVVALLASWGPARRAMRVDPTVAMRAD